MIDAIKQMERDRLITTPECDKLIRQYKYLHDRNIPIKYIDGIEGGRVLANQIRKTYWYNLTFEDWFIPRYYITESIVGSSGMDDMTAEINKSDASKCSEGYEILTRNQTLTNRSSIVVTTYKKVESFKDYYEREKINFTGLRAKKLEKFGAWYNARLGYWVW